MKIYVKAEEVPKARSKSNQLVYDAKNSNDPERLREIAETSNNERALKYIAKNPNTPEDVLVDFIKNKSCRVEMYIPYRRLSIPTIYELIDLPKFRSRLRFVASDKNAPLDLIEKLLDIASTDLSNLDYMFAIEALIARKDLPEDIYRQIYELEDSHIDYELARYRKHIPQDIVSEILAEHPDWEKNNFGYY